MSNANGYRNKMPAVYDVKNFIRQELGVEMVHQIKSTNEYIDLLVMDDVVTAVKVIKVSTFDHTQYSRSKQFNESYERLCVYLNKTSLEEAYLFVKLRTQGYFVYKVSHVGNGNYSVAHLGKLETKINTWRKGVC